MLIIENIPLSQIKPFPKNAKLHPKEQVAQIVASIKEFGFNDPIAVSENGEVIEGHGRLLAVKELGFTEVPCIRLSHLSEAQKRAYILAHNKLTMNTGFDADLLIGELDFLKGEGFDSTLTGFSVDEIEKMFNTDKEVTDDNFDFEKAASEPPFTLSGDLWHLGRHRLLVGDSTKAEDVSRLMDGKRANLLLTDPPYMVNYQGKAGNIKNDDLNDKAAYEFLLSAFKQMESVMSDDASIYVFYADSKGLIFRRAFDEAGFKLASNCIWVKSNFTFGRSDYKWGHEVCLYGWKKSGKHKWHGDAKQSTVWHCDKPAKNEGHPTVKPIPLLAIPLQNSSSPNSIVLDPFSGSFSTGILCEQTDRVCYGLELDPVYASVCVRRFREHSPSAEITVERDGNILTLKEILPL